MKEATMKVNPENLVKSLKFSFSNGETYLGELMQNARRAGASKVQFEFVPELNELNILKVTDDGCGIDSIDTLLTVSESGWDAELIAQEHPFGIGFLSALFACQHITVVSKGGRLSVDTDKILSFQPVSIEPIENWDGITSITMIGVDIQKTFLETLKKLSKGFPIPVIVNGEDLPRPHAINSGLKFSQNEVGSISLRTNIGQFNTVFCVYLQGMPIYTNGNYRLGDFHIIHLESSLFFARLPDRDKLIDEEAVVETIREALRVEIEKHFVSLKQAISAEEFVRHYQMLKQWSLLSILNDVPVIPQQVLSCFVDDNEESYPVSLGAYEDCYYLECIEEPLKREDVGNVRIFDIENDYDDIAYDGAVAHMYVRAKKAMVYMGGLDDKHWLIPHIRKINAKDITVTLVNESHNSLFHGSKVWFDTRFCDSYRIKLGDDSVEITDQSMFFTDDSRKCVISPTGDKTALVLRQVSSYYDENDSYQEELLSSDESTYVKFVVANTSPEPSVALKSLLPNFHGVHSVYGKTFTLSITDTGGVDTVDEDVSELLLCNILETFLDIVIEDEHGVRINDNGQYKRGFTNQAYTLLSELRDRIGRRQF
jgi:hypothetical protein